MSFDDYLTVERMMEALYEADKLISTGWINYWDKNSFTKHRGDASGTLVHDCDTLFLDGEDRLLFMEVTSHAEEVSGISMQSMR